VVDDEGEPILLKISHYNPALGGVNCLTFVDGECISKMASGEEWQEWIDKAIACPRELPFGTKIVVGKEEWICKDRGGAIVVDNGAYWIDQLTETPRYPFGELVWGVVYKS